MIGTLHEHLLREQMVKNTYIKLLIDEHIHKYYTNKAIEIWNETNLIFIEAANICNIKSSGLYVISDLDPTFEVCSIDIQLGEVSIVKYHQIFLNDQNYKHYPNNGYYINDKKCICVDFNILGHLKYLLCATDVESILFDRHDRELSENDPYFKSGLYRRPLFNEAVYFLVACAIRLKDNRTDRLNVPYDYIKTPKAYISHDMDQMSATNIWTFLNFLKMPIVAFKNGLSISAILSLVCRTIAKPELLYSDTLKTQVKYENEHGYIPALYVLIGTSGRYGSRTTFKSLIAFFNGMRNFRFKTGIHYNYDTFDNLISLPVQLKLIEKITGEHIKSGRAHYLKFDPRKSFDVIAEAGLLLDESIGYHNHIGFKSGVAGVYRSYYNAKSKDVIVYELPLMFMDYLTLKDDLSMQYLESMLDHIARIGGAISILFHPGYACSDVYPAVTENYKKVFKLLSLYNYIDGDYNETLN